MHDLDRTLNEFEAGIDALESDEFEYMGEWAPEYGVLGEADEMQLAAELLEVTDEQELEQFFGKLIKKAASGVRAFANSSTGKALGGILKDAAGKALPVVGGAIGGAIGGARGQQFGNQAGDWARSQLGWELEGMSEEQEFETARSLVRVAAAAAQNAAQAPAAAASPVAAAKQAAITAAKQHAPELIRTIATAKPGGTPGGAAGGQSGRWIRKGSTIVLFGV
ncbi:MAG TPA: hypothetical protein VHG28_19230 [Longimicrobiaceae bacterium]|nr:hypothetical protein [Longimicrobiaceae bacterium]